MGEFMYKNKLFYFCIILLFTIFLTPFDPCCSHPGGRFAVLSFLEKTPRALLPNGVRSFVTSYHRASTNYSIVSYTEEHVPFLQEAFCCPPWNKPSDLFENYLREQRSKERLVWLAFAENKACGYVTLKWKSLYIPFQEKGIPEVSDLNVIPEFRSRGIGAALVEIAEKAARENSCSHIGLGVGLYKDYGHAQKLYARRGYVPDGKGVTYDFQPVKPGKKVILDDDLNLWLKKEL